MLRKAAYMEGDQQDLSASPPSEALSEVATLLAQEQHARRIREDRFRAVAEASSDLLWITTPDGFMHEESSTWRTFTGQGTPDALGRTWLDAIHPDDREQLEMTRIQTLTTGWVYEVECRIHRVDGGYRLVLVRGVPVRGADGSMVEWIGIGTDLTEQKQTEHELKRQEHIVQTQADLIALAHDAILIRDPDSRIVAWNHGAEALYGWTEQEAVGKMSHTLLQTRSHASREAVDLALATLGHWEGQLTHTCRDGKHLIVDSRQVLVRNETGQPTAILEINRDVTERERLLHEQAEAKARELALQETARQMDAFLGIASHELKTPLTSVKGNLQLAKRQLTRLKLQEAVTEEDVTRTLSTVEGLLDRGERQISVQNRLINDLIDVSRIQTNQLNLQMAPCDLVMIVREVVEDQRILAPTRTIRWNTQVLEANVLADADRVGQVVNNYLTNALKYSEADKPVDVRLEQEEAMIRGEVADEGPGLSEVQQQHIWDRFTRVEGIDVKSGTGVGLGLGLYICRNLIERQGGQVGLKSEKGRGSAFWFTLPLAPTQS
jgi:PAS domain S-box-containing protein